MTGPLQFGPPAPDGHWVHPPADLPTSPTGRTPAWVVDEWENGYAEERVAPAPRRRRRRLLVGVVAVLAAGTWWWTSGAPALPDEVAAVLPGLVQPALPPPSADVIALADEAYLTAEGRELLYGTQPEILGAAAFAGRCADVGMAPVVRADGAVGCFRADANSIVVYAPADPRLRGFVVESIAHETLHAAWNTLDDAERTRLAALLETVVASLPADDRIHQQIAGSVGANPANRQTELFAYVGTQVAPGLDPQLEAAYARFVSDRTALVAVHTGWVAVGEGLATAIDDATTALVAQEYANAEERARINGDEASVQFYRDSYEAKVAEVAAMSASQLDRLRLSWTWWDGTVLEMAPAEKTLDAAAALLARDEAALPARYATVDAADVVAATERARIEGLVADLTALQSDMDPGSAAPPG